MERSRLETKVGLFVFIGLVLLAALLIQFSKGTSLFRGTYVLHLHAGNVGGLKQRATVLLAGVQVGSVANISLDESGTNVNILLRIYKDYKIFHDARFVIEQSGFLGDQYVSVIPTSNAPPVLADGDDVYCEAPFNLQEVARSASGFIQRIDETAKKLDDSVTDLRRVVLNAQTMTNMAVAITDMRSFSEQAVDTVGDINQLIATNGSQINLAVSNLVEFSQQLLALSGKAGNMLDSNGPAISNAVKNVESSTEVLKSILNDTDAGKGLAGTMLHNEQLAANVQAIANNLAVASSNLNRLGLWRFLWHKEPLRTNAPPAKSTSR